MKKLVIVLLFILLLIPHNKVYAAAFFEAPINQTNKALNAAKNGEVSADAMAYFEGNVKLCWVMSLVSGICSGEQNMAELQENIKKSALAQSSNLVNTLYENPAASTQQYLAYMGDKAGLIPKTYAQGITYSRLLPLLPVWKAFRDVAYMFLTVFMMIIGVMIMFRAKINPQTVASVENTIPNVIVTLILITFSFPIAAFIIDMCYVIISAGVGLIGTSVGDTNINIIQAQQELTNSGMGALWNWALWYPMGQYMSQSAAEMTGSLGGAGVGALAVGSLFFPVGTIIGGVVGALAGGMLGLTAGGGGSAQDIGGGLLSAGLSPILLIIMFFALLFGVFRIFFMLLSNYIQIIISIVLSPAILLLNVFPGQNTFNTWWKGILGNMLSFVVTAIMLYLAYVISGRLGSEPFWVAPFLINGMGIPQMVTGLIGLGIILLIPDIAKKAKGALAGKGGLLPNVGPGLVLGPAAAGVSQTWGQLKSYNPNTVGGKVIEKGLETFGIKSKT